MKILRVSTTLGTWRSQDITSYCVMSKMIIHYIAYWEHAACVTNIPKATIAAWSNGLQVRVNQQDYLGEEDLKDKQQTGHTIRWN